MFFSERCENPENFEDYDICGGITADMCDEPDYVDMFAEFCPTVCSCSEYYCSSITVDMCDEPDYVDMFAEFCPTVCSCSKYYCSMVDAFSLIFADV